MRPPDLKPSDPPSGPHPGEKPGILVVDHDHLVRAVLQLGLERDGFNVWSAADGRDAIRLYRTHREHVSVVVLDICMPGLDGIRTLDALRQLNPEVQACFMSGAAGAYERDELSRCGAAAVIRKPFYPIDLVRLLRQMTHTVPDGLVSSGEGDQG